MNVLQLGLKEWPLSAGIKEDKNRGGGTGKYCEILFSSLAKKNIRLFIITRKLKNQETIETNENIKTYRYKTITGRKLRHISLAFITFIKAFTLIRKEKIDIIHSHMFLGNITAIFIGSIFPNLSCSILSSSRGSKI